MSGTIGLTKSGQLLDKYLLTNPIRGMYGFIHTLTCKMASIRKSENKNNTVFVLSLLKDHYLKKLDSMNIDYEPYLLIHKYICEVSKSDFIPTTKTQVSIRNKQKVVLK